MFTKSLLYAFTAWLIFTNGKVLADEKNILDFIDSSFHNQIRSGNYTTLNTESFTIAIQKALDSIQSGGSIYFPAEQYIVTRGFQLFDGTIIRGESRREFIIRLQDSLPKRINEANQTVFFTGKNAYSLNQTTGTNKITIQDLSLDAN